MDDQTQAQFVVAIAAIRDAETLYVEAERMYKAKVADVEAHLLPFKGCRESARHALDEAREALRRLGAHTHACTQEKALPGGVRVREMTRLRYDAQVALQWAIEHRMALELAKKEFEAIAQASKLPFVEEERYVQVLLPASFLATE